MGETKHEVSKGCLIPSDNSDLTKEQVRTNLRRIIEETHRRHEGKKEHYRINVISGGPLGQFAREELEEMGCTVRDMPVIKKDPAKKDK